MCLHNSVRYALAGAITTLALCSHANAQNTAPAQAPEPTSRPRFVGDGGDATEASLQRTRRGGLTLAVLAATQLTTASGTPTQFEKRNDAFRVTSGAAAGAGGALLVGVTFSDTFGFHLGISNAVASRGELRLRSTTFLLGVDAYPFFGMGGAWRDLGLTVDVGTGAPTTKRSNGSFVASAGSASVFRIGTYFEAARTAKFLAGPWAAFEHAQSDTYAQNTMWLGLRLAYVAGP